MWLVRFERYERYGGIRDPNSDREGMGCVRVWIGSSPCIGANKNQGSHMFEPSNIYSILYEKSSRH